MFFIYFSEVQIFLLFGVSYLVPLKRLYIDIDKMYFNSFKK